MKENQPITPQIAEQPSHEGGASLSPPAFQLQASHSATSSEEGAAPLQFSRAAAEGGTASPAAPPSTGGGQEMPMELRQHMEGALGASFAGVKIEKDSSEADKMGALAMTDGETIKFGKGQFKPNTKEGMELIGHELGHIKERQTTEVAATGMENGVAVNTDRRSEDFADQMGQQAAAYAGGGELMAEGGQLSTGPIQMAEDPRTPRLDGYAGQRMNQQGAISSPGDQYKSVYEYGVNVRAKPDSSLDPIAQIRYGRRVHIMALDTTGTFYFVSSQDGKTGWVTRSFVATGMPDPMAEIHHITEPDLTTILQRHYVDSGLWSLSSGNDLTTLAMAVHVANAGRSGVRIDMKKYQAYKREHPIINAVDPTIENRAVFHAADIIRGTNVWLPSVEYIRAMQDGGAVPTRPDWMNNAVKAGNGYTGFSAGIIAGAAGNIWDTLTGLWDLGSGIVSTIRSLFDGSLFSSLSDIYQQVANEGFAASAEQLYNSVVSSVSAGVKDFAKSWTQADVFKMWYFRGQVVGNIALEVVLAIFTGGGTLGAKVLAKIGKYFPTLAKALNKLTQAADKLNFGRGRKGSDGKGLTQQIDPEANMDDSPTRDWYQTLALARLVTESHDARNTPVEVLIPLLNRTLGAKSKAVKGYQANPIPGKGGHFQIIQMKRREDKVDADYTPKHTYLPEDKDNFRDRKDHRTLIANARWAKYDKHMKAKSVEDAIRLSSTGLKHAQYVPGINVRLLEYTAMQRGIVHKKPNSTTLYFFYKSDSVVGYDQGKATQWIRAELTSGEFHGHPMNTDRLWNMYGIK